MVVSVAMLGAGSDPAGYYLTRQANCPADYYLGAEEAKAYGLIDEVFAGSGESLISMTQAAGGKVPTAKEAAAAEAKPKK